MKKDQIPEGYMQNANGALMPIDKIKPVHKLEDDTVQRLIAEAKVVSAALAKFKDIAMVDAQTFRALVAEKHGAKKGGAKGGYGQLDLMRAQAADRSKPLVLLEGCRQSPT